MVSGYTLGVDLGTTNSAAAVITGESPEIIPNDIGERTTPSVVAFDDDGPFVGQTAKNQAVTNPERTVRGIKRYMGEQDHATEINGEEYSPEELSALILKTLVRDSEAHIGSNIHDAVITVPAYFGNRQRQATKTAGEIAGLNVKRIINEPTAACLSYGLQRDDDDAPGTVLVYDLGGGTFDVSIVEISSGIVEVVATGGDDELGGQDWDACIVDWILEKHEQNTGEEVSDDPETMQRVWSSAQNAKHVLSSKNEADIVIPYLSEDGNFDETLTRAEFEDLTRELIEQTIETCEKTLTEAGYDTGEIGKILLVGGSTRMKQVHTAVTSYFGQDPSQEVNPDEAVAMGAAIQGSLLDSGNELAEKQLPGGEDGVLLVDVMSKTLGIELADRSMDELIEKNTTLPTTVVKGGYTTVQDNQKRINIRVFEGGNEIAEENELLDEFYLTGIENGRAGEPEFEVTFSLDLNGILDVEVTDVKQGKTEAITIEGVLEVSPGEIKQMRDSLPALNGDVAGAVTK